MALITNTDTSILPYNDDYMVYDLDRHMYVLTIAGVRALTGHDLLTICGSTAEAELIRYEVSEDVYNFISMYSLVQSYKVKQWYIAKKEVYRDEFKRILADQFRYYITSGAGTLKDMHGVAIEKGKAMDLMDLRGKALVSFSVEAKLRQNGLLYLGRLYSSEYSDDGTW